MILKGIYRVIVLMLISGMVLTGFYLGYKTGRAVTTVISVPQQATDFLGQIDSNQPGTRPYYPPPPNR